MIFDLPYLHYSFWDGTSSGKNKKNRHPKKANQHGQMNMDEN